MPYENFFRELEIKPKIILLRCSNKKNFLKTVTGVLGGAYNTDKPLKKKKFTSSQILKFTMRPHQYTAVIILQKLIYLS